MDEILSKGGCGNRLKYSLQTTALKIITGEPRNAKQCGIYDKFGKQASEIISLNETANSD